MAWGRLRVSGPQPHTRQGRLLRQPHEPWRVGSPHLDSGDSGSTVCTPGREQAPDDIAVMAEHGCTLQMSMEEASNSNDYQKMVQESESCIAVRLKVLPSRSRRKPAC